MMNELDKDGWYSKITKEIENRYIEAADYHWNKGELQDFRWLKIEDVDYSTGTGQGFS